MNLHYVTAHLDILLFIYCVHEVLLFFVPVVHACSLSRDYSSENFHFCIFAENLHYGEKKL